MLLLQHVVKLLLQKHVHKRFSANEAEEVKL